MAEDANVASGKRFRFQRIMNDGDDDDQPQYLSNEDEPGKAKKRLKRTLDDTPKHLSAMIHTINSRRRRDRLAKE